MIGYICKYAPAEIIEAFGEDTMLIEPGAVSFTQADCLMHSNMCSFIKGVLEDFENAQDGPAGSETDTPERSSDTCPGCGGCDAPSPARSTADYMKDCEGMIFTNCCDSSRRLCDTLSAKHPDKFFFCLDLPRKINDFSSRLYEGQINALIRAYHDFSGKTFSAERFLEICDKKLKASLSAGPGKTAHETLRPVPGRRTDGYERTRGGISSGEPEKRSPLSESTRSCRPKVALCGARCGTDIKRLIEKLGADIILDMTCSGMSRSFTVDRNAAAASYSRCLLDQIPCMRMASNDLRDRVIGQYADDLDGIIYHTLKFCDIYPYEYTHMHSEGSSLPILNIETDAAAGCSGQILTRLEAFLESLRGHTSPVKNSRREGSAAVSKTYVCGIDSGSTSTNAVIMDSDRNIAGFLVLRTGAKSAESAEKIFEGILKKTGLSRDELSLTVSTGYGRISIPFADKNVTEISCHAKGAHFLNPDVRTILDIGGQDSKAIRIDSNGSIADFAMNDKCAAGTGRFLEMMARTLEIDISELGPISLGYKENIEISSMCSVFAESEVISLIAQNKDTADIARGIHNAIGKKAFSLMKRVGLEGDFMMTGGVAKNPGVVDVMEGLLKSRIYIYEQPEIVGAIGAALCALDELGL